MASNQRRATKGAHKRKRPVDESSTSEEHQERPEKGGINTYDTRTSTRPPKKKRKIMRSRIASIPPSLLQGMVESPRRLEEACTDPNTTARAHEHPCSNGSALPLSFLPEALSLPVEGVNEPLLAASRVFSTPDAVKLAALARLNQVLDESSKGRLYAGGTQHTGSHRIAGLSLSQIQKIENWRRKIAEHSSFAPGREESNLAIHAREMSFRDIPLANPLLHLSNLSNMSRKLPKKHKGEENLAPAPAHMETPNVKNSGPAAVDTEGLKHTSVGSAKAETGPPHVPSGGSRVRVLSPLDIRSPPLPPAPSSPPSQELWSDEAVSREDQGQSGSTDKVLGSTIGGDTANPANVSHGLPPDAADALQALHR